VKVFFFFMARKSCSEMFLSVYRRWMLFSVNFLGQNWDCLTRFFSMKAINCLGMDLPCTCVWLGWGIALAHAVFLLQFLIASDFLFSY
jgi:hypothetical protein